MPARSPLQKVQTANRKRRLAQRAAREAETEWIEAVQAARGEVSMKELAFHSGLTRAGLYKAIEAEEKRSKD